MKVELGPPLAASLLLAAALTLAGLALVAGWADLTLAEEERDAKTGFVSRDVRTGQSAAGSPGATPAIKLFVDAESETLAAAQVDALVRSIVAEAGGVVTSSRAEVKRDEVAVAGRIEVQAVVEAPNDAIQQILLRLETGAPMMLVDDLAIQPAASASADAVADEDPQLHAALTLSAYWRSPPK